VSMVNTFMREDVVKYLPSAVEREYMKKQMDLKEEGDCKDVHM